MGAAGTAGATSGAEGAAQRAAEGTGAQASYRHGSLARRIQLLTVREASTVDGISNGQ